MRVFSLDNLISLVLLFRPMIICHLTLDEALMGYSDFGKGHRLALSEIMGFLRLQFKCVGLASGSMLCSRVNHLWSAFYCHFRSSSQAFFKNLHRTQTHSYISNFFDSMPTHSTAHYSNTAKRCFFHRKSCFSLLSPQDAVSLRTVTKAWSSLWAQLLILNDYRLVCQSVMGKIYIFWSRSKLDRLLASI